ncbi:MAG: hypothetical protein JW749_09280 [Sedimentisphaerales bacterium]|nr:hypothetical protein [Sedimentisphaerales bacterium]
MKNGFSKRWFCPALCFVFIIAITGTGISIAEEEVEEASEEPVLESHFADEIGVLQRKAEAESQDVNETIEKEIKKAELRKKVRYREELGYIPKGNLLSEEELAVFEMERQEKLEAVRGQFGKAIENVKELGAASAQLHSAETVEEKPPANRNIEYGTVTGIVLYEVKGAALVAGRVVRANNVVGDIKVVRILPDYVEFEKQGRKWVQEVGQSPPAGVWEQKDKKSP